MEHMHASELNKATVERDQKMNEMQTDKIRDLLRQLEMSKYNHSKEIEQVIN